jgi:hypothetical protein
MLIIDSPLRYAEIIAGLRCLPDASVPTASAAQIDCTGRRSGLPSVTRMSQAMLRPTTLDVSCVPGAWWDDEQLLALLKESLQARQAVPPEFIEIGKNAYAWHNIDAELAQLSYDSIHDSALYERSETASVRSLTFTSAHVTIELEVDEDSLFGQTVPAQEGTIQVRTPAGAIASIPVDKVGYFAIRPIPPGSFRLHYRSTSGSDVLTGWITL